MASPPRVFAVVVSFALFSSGCGMRHLARTLGRDRSELRASLGGPLLSVPGATFPVPSVRLGYRYGLTDWLDADGDLTLDGLLLGVLVLDSGFVGQIVRDPNGFALSLSARVHFVVDLDDNVTTRAFPELGLHAEHRVERWLTIFGGIVAVAEVEPPLGKPPIFAAPYLGVEVMTDVNGQARQGMALEIAWISPWEDLRSFASWEPAGAGALVVVLGWRGVFGRGSERPFP